jgi:SAM-dependent methyltransferase
LELKNLVKNELDQKAGVYYLKGQGSFNYSDGDEIEDYIHNVIKGAKDISSSSRELEQKIKDWPSLYHLSRARSIAYKSLSLPQDASVLEVGAGCGAITRFLGERVAEVVALEGSPRRAAITRARTRDLDSVAVLCASFEDVVFNRSFDFVICNGVLEYAPLFINHEHPAQQLIRLLTSLLKPSGNLIVAIENKFGLRYFSSGKEEHTNKMFDGIEGYARFPKGPKTFGFAELHAMLSESCAFVETFLPLPDYKLPTALIRAELTDEVNCSDLFESTARHDFGSYEEPRMHERLVWYELQKNRLLKIFANSFFMVAGHEKTSLFTDGWMGDIYSIKRNADLMVKTTIVKQQSGEIRTNKYYFECKGMAKKKINFDHVLDESSWINGVSIHTIISREMLRSQTDRSLEERFRKPILAWWEGIKAFACNDNALGGEALDCIWRNAILAGGKVCFIDKEWKFNRQIDPALIIYRSVVNFAAQEIYYLNRWSRSCRRLSEISLMRKVARVLGINMTINSIIKAMQCDLELLEVEGLHGKRASRFKRFFRLFVPFSLLKFSNNIIRKMGIITCKSRNLLGRLSGRF